MAKSNNRRDAEDRRVTLRRAGSSLPKEDGALKAQKAKGYGFIDGSVLREAESEPRDGCRTSKTTAIGFAVQTIADFLQ